MAKKNNARKGSARNPVKGTNGYRQAQLVIPLSAGATMYGVNLFPTRANAAYAQLLSGIYPGMVIKIDSITFEVTCSVNDGSGSVQWEDMDLGIGRMDFEEALENVAFNPILDTDTNSYVRNTLLMTVNQGNKLTFTSPAASFSGFRRLGSPILTSDGHQYTTHCLGNLHTSGFSGQCVITVRYREGVDLAIKHSTNVIGTALRINDEGNIVESVGTESTASKKR